MTDPFSLGPWATVIGVALIAAGFYLIGSYWGVSMKAAKRLEADGYNRGWNAGREVGNRSGRREGWYAAHKLALSYLKDTPFSRPLRDLVKALALGEEPLGETRNFRMALHPSATTTDGLDAITLTGDGDE